MTVVEFYEKLKLELSNSGFIVRSHINKKGDYLLRIDFGQLRDIRVGTKRTYNKTLKYNVSLETRHNGIDNNGCVHFPLVETSIQSLVTIFKEERDKKCYDIGRRKLSSIRNAEIGYSIKDKESIILIAKGREIYNRTLNYRVQHTDKLKNFT